MRKIGTHYRLGKKIGSGAFGEVYLAKDLLSDKDVAIKFVPPNPEGLSLKTEFSFLLDLHHPNFCEVFDFGKDPESGREFMVTEYVDGKNFFDATASMNPEELESLWLEALTSLDFIHSQNLIHYDVKCSNLFVRDTPRPPGLKLLDFGLAAWAKDPITLFKGTPAYAAPELWLGIGGPDPRIDLYGLGIVFLRAHLRQFPFDVENLSAIRQWHLQSDPLDTLESRKNLRNYQREFLLRLLAKNPNDRFSQARVAIDWLELNRKGGKSLSLALKPRTPAPEGKFVGRKLETEVFTDWLQNPKTQGLLVLGDKGVGKTRLLKEWKFLAELQGKEEWLILEDAIDARAQKGQVELQENIRRSYALWLSGDAPPFLFIGTCAHHPENLLQWKEALAPMKVQEITLHPFSLEMTCELFAAEFPGINLPKEKIEKIFSATGGVPALLENFRQMSVREGSFELKIEKEKPDLWLKNHFAAKASSLQPEERACLFPILFLEEPIFLKDLADLAGLSWPNFLKVFRKLNREGWVEWDFGAKQACPLHPNLGKELVPLFDDKEKKRAYQGLLRYYERWPASAAILRKRATYWALLGEGTQSLELWGECARKAEKEGHPLEAIAAYNEVLRLAPSTEETTLQARRRLGYLHIMTGEPKKGEEFLRSLPHPTLEDEKTLGWALVSMDRYQEAIKYYQEILTRMGPKNPESAEIKNQMANSWLHLGENQTATQLFQETLGQAPDQLSANNLGIALASANQFEAALRFYEKKLSWAKKEGAGPLVAQTLSEFGYVLMRQGDFPRALEALQEAWQISSSITDYHNYFILLDNLVTVCQRLGHYDQALEFLEKAFAVRKKSGSGLELAHHYMTMGFLYVQLGMHERAEDLFFKAESIFAPFGERRLRGWVALGRSYIYQERAEIGACEKEWQKASEFAQESGDLELQAWVHLSEAEGAIEKEDFPAARQFLDDLKRGPATLPDKLRLRTLFIQEKLNWRKDPDPARGKMLRLAQEAQNLYCNELAWEIHYTLGDLTSDTDEIEKGRTILNSLAGKLTEAYRINYVSLKKSRELRNWQSKKTNSMKGGGMDWIQSVRTMLDSQRGLVRERDPDRLLKTVLDSAIRMSGAERGLVLLYHPERGFTVKTAALFLPGEEIPTNFSQTISKQVIEGRTSLVTGSAIDDPKLKGLTSIVNFRVQSLLVIPILLATRPIGVIYLENNSRPGAFKQEDVPLLELFAEQSALLLENTMEAKALEEYGKRVEEELQKTKERLQETEQKFQEVSAWVQEAQRARETRYAYDNIVGRSKKLESVLKLLDKITDTQIPVLILGETGTGKELIAKALHYNSSRKKKEFLGINCAAFPETILESELFGYQKGAFTGADRDQMGLFEQAQGGTLFLDEIGNMSLAMQAKLLRAIQEKEIRRIGGHTSIKIDVRLAAASNVPLEPMIQQGKFREDLYYRVNGFSIELPPIRERKEDLALLIHHFIEKAKVENKLKAHFKIEKHALQSLYAYEWPGNVRELEQVITNACILAEGGKITEEHLLLGKRLKDLGITQALGLTPGKPLSYYERKIIEETLKYYDGNKRKAAEILGITRTTLRRKLQEARIQSAAR